MAALEIIQDHSVYYKIRFEKFIYYVLIKFFGFVFTEINAVQWVIYLLILCASSLLIAKSRKEILSKNVKWFFLQIFRNILLTFMMEVATSPWTKKKHFPSGYWASIHRLVAYGSWALLWHSIKRTGRLNHIRGNIAKYSNEELQIVDKYGHLQGGGIYPPIS